MRDHYSKKMESMLSEKSVEDMDSEERAEFAAACFDMEYSEFVSEFVPDHCEFVDRLGGVDIWINAYLKGQGFID